MKNFLKNQTGFSLLELTVVLGIVGVIGGGLLYNYSENRTHTLWMESESKLKVAKKALLEFVKQNKYMPCPDTDDDGFENRDNAFGNLALVPATTGQAALLESATRPSIPSVADTPEQAAISNIPVSTCSAVSGGIPYEALGLNLDSVRDTWGNPFIYAVDQGVDDANLMVDCPTQTACFFNSDPLPAQLLNATLEYHALPAFDLSTQPLKGTLGANNLNICSVADCSSIEADGQVAVIVATNQNGYAGNTSLAVAETENQDTDRFFVNEVYSESPYFDDQVIGISANEIKLNDGAEALEVVNTFTPPPQVVTENLTYQGVTQLTGGSGSNNAAGDLGFDYSTQTISFGQEHAGKTVTLNVRALITGGWEDDDAGLLGNKNYGGVNDTENNETQDVFMIATNQGSNLSAIDGSVGQTVADVESNYLNNSDGTLNKFYYDEHDIIGGDGTSHTGANNTQWDDKISLNATLDDNGDLEIDFIIMSTHQGEDLEFQGSNVNATLYEPVSIMPSFPSTQVSVEGETVELGGS